MRFPPPARNWRAPNEEPSTLETDLLPYLGQLNPIHEARLMRQRGRMLSGLGGEELPSEYTVNPTDTVTTVQIMPQETSDNSMQEILACEEADDVLGSGVFDPVMRATANPNMGVFTSNYDLPGFINREELFAPNKSLIDSPNGGDVVVVPGGGAFYIDKSKLGGAYTQPFGPPGAREAAPPGSFAPQSYWNPPPAPAVTVGPTLSNPYAAPPTLLEPPATVQPMAPPMISDATPQYGPAAPQVPPAAWHAPGAQWQHAPQSLPRTPMTAARPKFNVLRPTAPRPQSIRGLGDDTSGPSTMTVVLAGALLGAGAAMVWGYYKGTK